jgi:hypothetical protein
MPDGIKVKHGHSGAANAGQKWSPLDPESVAAKKHVSELFKEFVAFLGQIDWSKEAASLGLGRRAAPGDALALHIVVHEDRTTSVGPSIEDPFDPSRNLGTCVTAMGITRLKFELTRATQLISQSASFAEVMEPWIPPERSGARDGFVDENEDEPSCDFSMDSSMNASLDASREFRGGLSSPDVSLDSASALARLNAQRTKRPIRADPHPRSGSGTAAFNSWQKLRSDQNLSRTAPGFDAAIGMVRKELGRHHPDFSGSTAPGDSPDTSLDSAGALASRRSTPATTPRVQSALELKKQAAMKVWMDSSPQVPKKTHKAPVNDSDLANELGKALLDRLRKEGKDHTQKVTEWLLKEHRHGAVSASGSEAESSQGVSAMSPVRVSD